VAFGRIGNVLAVYVGNYALQRGGSPAYFTTWAILMGLVFLSLALIGRHVPRSAQVLVQAAPSAR
jgi:AAHS family 4-hydroxybenzoate transporter-like MFS transporter